MPNRTMGVYTIRNAVTGRVYVGSSSDVDARLKSHRYFLNQGRPVNKALGADWLGHGADAFTFSLVEEITGAGDATPLIEAEQRWIAQLTREGIQLYNIVQPFAYTLVGATHKQGPYEILPLEENRRGLITESQAAKRIGISYRTLRAWAARGGMPAWRTTLGELRFDPAVIDQVMADSARGGVLPVGAPEGFISAAKALSSFPREGIPRTHVARSIEAGHFAVHYFPDYGQGKWRFIAIADLGAFIAAERERAA